MPKLADAIEKLVITSGRLAAWLTLVMVMITVVVVVMRHFFDAGFIWMQELVTWAHAAVFLLGAAYTLACDEHVRVDVFYRKASPRVQALVNIGGTCLLLWPVCFFLLVPASRYAAKSWQIAERSAETGGLGWPMVPLAKSLLVMMLLLLIAQGLVIVLRNVYGLRTGQFTDAHGHGQGL